MVGFCCRRLQLLLPSSEVDKPQEQDGSFTVSILINLCGLSSKLALSVSNRVHIDNREGPDSVLKLLKDHGFDDTYIAQLVKKCPKALLVNADKTLLPKLEFFSSIGLSGSGIAQVICCNPTVLQRNVDRNLRPCYDIIESLLLPDIKLDVFFKHYRNVTVKLVSNISRNVSVVRELKVSESTVSANVVRSFCTFP
ncbi:hypothetical protein M0R45_020935 [Rubus argutus]|uniref:Uncharacterized protein n=1 Tax=Rubus argutus TaxID=59490 RepID=A0AAW1XBR0_RUBAR